MNLPKIIKTTFYVDQAHGRNYHIDVNQDTSFRDIKQMLVVASKVNRLGLRIFDKNNKEYTKFREETLEELFPDKDNLEFFIKIDRRYKGDEYDQLKLGSHCNIHQNKFCFFYCNDCELSVCSSCLNTGDHINHSLTEKTDYLRPSKEIVADMFNGLDDIVMHIENMSISDVEEFRIKLKMDYFPSLISLLKKIEHKLEKQIDIFTNHYHANIKRVKDNAESLKELCADGLDELREQIEIEKLLKDEGVFLHFDYKIKELTQHKEKIHEDTAKVRKILGSFSYSKLKIENIYQDIKSYLEMQLNSTMYEEILRRTTEFSIDYLSKDSILTKLLSDFRKQGGKVVSDVSRLSKGKINCNDNSLNSIIIESNGSKRKSNLEVETKPTNQPIHLDEKNFNDQILANEISTVNETGHDNISLNGYKDDYLISEGNQINLRNRKDNKKLTYVMNAIEGQSDIIVYESESNEGKVTQRRITMKKNIHGIENFLKGFASVNTGQFLYISGGYEGENISNVFLKYSPQAHTILRYSDMLTPKFNHSLYFSEDQIFSVGGYNTHSTEKYDIKTNQWLSMNPLLEERQSPILYMKGKWLYAFLGHNNNMHPVNSKIERISTISMKSKWENLMPKMPNGMELPLCKAAIVLSDNDNENILILGGMNSNSKGTKLVVEYDFYADEFKSCAFTLEDDAYFSESMMIKFTNEENCDYCLYNNCLYQLLKLNMMAS